MEVGEDKADVATVEVAAEGVTDAVADVAEMQDAVDVDVGAGGSQRRTHPPPTPLQYHRDPRRRSFSRRKRRGCQSGSHQKKMIQ